MAEISIALMRLRNHINRGWIGAVLKGTVSRDFLLLVFFMNQFPPRSRVFHLDHFEFFRKFAEIFANECLSAVTTTPAKKEKNFEINFSYFVESLF